MANDDTDLERFVNAQEGVYERALSEIRSGRKRGHWMWFIFPQLRGLGRSATSERYAIQGIGEARAFLAHPVLGPRLVACTAAALESGTGDPAELFGWPDTLKFRSSMTLFAEVAGDESCFRAALARFYGGRADDRTLALLRDEQDS